MCARSWSWAKQTKLRARWLFPGLERNVDLVQRMDPSVLTSGKKKDSNKPGWVGAPKQEKGESFDQKG